ncbi:FAD-dependent oxidoreductase [Streptomyces sporangiiformans]|uniref:NAD(P)/FAD-dependent oxidoreductase n=1 Tax=Streptomyces sporangiiformans TaxID=2315329 RepID=A0A505D7T9_9ACTN|nr:FAD-dependent oxidoreductase [Streptomyces sporangiiformans]TPQ15556.1 NAD(P)/FAD-dependent oxidoreductase [Streptomyces sporangiiformans]
MPASNHVLVVGHGPAAHRLVERVRHHGHRGPVTALGAEPRPAYNRVLLTSLLGGTLTAEDLKLPDPPDGVRVRTGVTATAVDRARRLVHTDTGETHPYDHLVLATGARPRIPHLPGLLTADGGLTEGATALRTLADCERLADGPVVVLGAGVLGTETTLALLRAGRDVTLVHPGPHPMDDRLDDMAGALLADHLRSRGAHLRLRRAAAEYRPGKLALDDREILRADALVLCTGVEPETALARRAGLAVRTGVVVDRHLRTNDPRVHAIGDCAEFDGEAPGLVTTTWEQAETLARILSGEEAHHRADRPVVRLKAPGIDLACLGPPDPPGATRHVTLSDPARGRYARLALSGERILGGVLIGLPRATAAVGQLYERGLPVPSDRLGLLLGTAATERPASVELPDEAVLCHCNHVTKGDLLRAWRAGARDLPGVAVATRATTGCGGCADDVRLVLASATGGNSDP